MIRSWMNICLVAVISLALAVIWPSHSTAAQAPQLELLGEIKAGLRAPTRIDVDSSGNLFIADARLQKIFKFDRFGREQLVMDQEPVSGAGLAVTAAGDRIYASAIDKVVVFAVDGQPLGHLGQGAGEFVAAGPIDLDSDGNIYVVDLNRRHVKVFNPDGSSSGLLGASFVANSSLVFRPATDQIYLSDSVVARSAGLQPKVAVYDRSGNLQNSILASNGFGSAPVRFFGGMTFDSADRFYASDIEDMTIRVLDANGTPLLSYSRAGLNRPLAMAYDAVTNRLFVVQADMQVDIYGIDGAQNPVAVNHAPEIPVPVAPIGGSEAVTRTPDLQFSNAIDADEQDEISYNVKLFDAAQSLVTALTVAEQPTMTSVVFDVELTENSLYQWQVQAFDGQAESDWSDLQSFYVNAEQAAPSVPELIAPLASEPVKSDSLFEWLAATDADPFDSVNYRLEVATDAEFTEIVFTEELAATQRDMTDWNALLEPGETYSWQVTAIDNHGLETVSTADGSFLYQASLLSVTANMPGARAYLGGHHGYAGQFIGEAPVTLRDLPEGKYQLVVERAGFEPFVQPVEIKTDVRSEIYVELQPAQLPNDLAFKSLKVAGKAVKNGSVIAPLIADLNLDGIEDLLLTHADGSIHYHPGLLNNEQELADGLTETRKVSFQAEKFLTLPQLAGGTPCLIDWNNDYLQDLVIGTADGAVWLYLNQGDFGFTDTPTMLAAVGSAAVPAVADIDADGDKDLVVGSGDGELVLFRNLATDAAPQLAGPQLLVTFMEAAAPTFVDWNGDGQRELLIAAEGQVHHAVYSAGALTMKKVEVKDGPIARLFALDLTGVRGKDLVAGTTDGKLLMARSKKNNNQYVADFYLALESKLQQLKAALSEEGSEDLALLDPLFSSLKKQKMDRLSGQVEGLLPDLVDGSGSAVIARELLTILK